MSCDQLCGNKTEPERINKLKPNHATKFLKDSRSRWDKQVVLYHLYAVKHQIGLIKGQKIKWVKSYGNKEKININSITELNSLFLITSTQVNNFRHLQMHAVKEYFELIHDKRTIGMYSAKFTPIEKRYTIYEKMLAFNEIRCVLEIYKCRKYHRYE